MRTLARTRPKGFTLIELLVVIAIITVLISLHFPAIRKVDSASRRMRSASDQTLVQIGQSMQDRSHAQRQAANRGIEGALLMLYDFEAGEQELLQVQQVLIDENLLVGGLIQELQERAAEGGLERSDRARLRFAISAVRDLAAANQRVRSTLGAVLSDDDDLPRRRSGGTDF